ncbi:MAG: hydroxymethylglutaryl-CoA synthase [Patescibacteria group bacterium]|mgnify:CR=1 FL=1
MVGIVSYGTYIPRYRIRIADIAVAWNKDVEEVVRSLGLTDKSVPGFDEDAATIAVESAIASLSVFPGKAGDIDVMFVGSESHPYAVNPTSTIVGELLGIGHAYLAVDMEFACKAGTTAMQTIAGLIAAGHARIGMAIGTDTAQGKPHDFLEYTAAAGGAAFLLGSDHIVAKLLADTSYSSDTPDFWRRDGMRYPSHAGRFTGEPAYYSHVLGASHRLLEMTKTNPADYDYCIFHSPNGKFPREVARRLGFTSAQLAPSLLVDYIGNAYSATTMLSLAAVLDIARANQKIFMVSYGSGAGSDAFVWETTKELVSLQKAKAKTKQLVAYQIQQKTYVDYVQFLKLTHKL